LRTIIMSYIVMLEARLAGWFLCVFDLVCELVHSHNL